MKGVAPFTQPVDGAKPAPSSDPIALLNFAFKNSREAIRLVNFAAAAQASIFPPGNENDDAQVIVTVPASVALNLAGPPGQQDAYLLIHIERSVVDAMDEPPPKRPVLILPPHLRGRR